MWRSNVFMASKGEWINPQKRSINLHVKKLKYFCLRTNRLSACYLSLEGAIDGKFNS